ncbi:MAG: CYTH and CHAD domain-containing protein [Thiobacillaceae bacterium]
MEIEIKLALKARSANRIRRHPVLAGIKPTSNRLYSVYFDTPAFDLLRAGVAVRLRRVGFNWVQTVKARAGSGGVLTRRPEWEVKVTGKRPDLKVLPAEARQLIPASAWDGLSPVFETEFRRTSWEVKQGESLIEVALDRGEIRAGGQAWPIAELELELKSGELTDLFDLADRLLDDLPVHLEPRSKAQRGYQLAGALSLAPVKAAVPILDAEAAASTAFVAIARACMAQFEANLTGFLHMAQAHPEYVHQMRVAMRRLRAATGLMRFMQREPPAWVGELKWLMGELSVARDWDVFVTETLPRVRERLDQPALLDALTEVALALRRQANDLARTALSSPRLVRLWLAIERDLAMTADTPITTREWAKSALDRRYRQIRRLGSRLDELDPAERHALRIAGKKLRYAAEFFACLDPKAARRFIDTLAGLQDVLGILNDVAVTAHLLQEAKQAGGQAVWEGAGLVAGFLAREQELRLAELARRWREFRRARPYWR